MSNLLGIGILFLLTVLFIWLYVRSKNKDEAEDWRIEDED